MSLIYLYSCLRESASTLLYSYEVDFVKMSKARNRRLLLLSCVTAIPYFLNSLRAQILSRILLGVINKVIFTCVLFTIIYAFVWTLRFIYISSSAEIGHFVPSIKLEALIATGALINHHYKLEALINSMSIRFFQLISIRLLQIPRSRTLPVIILLSDYRPLQYLNIIHYNPVTNKFSHPGGINQFNHHYKLIVRK